MDFGSIVKESLKRTTNWSAKYFTHPRSYYPVPVNHIKLSVVYMTPLPLIMMSHEDQQLMRERTPNVYLNSFNAFQTIDFDTNSDCGRSEEPNLADIRSGLYETESTQAYEPCEGFDPEDWPTTRPTEMTLTTLAQTAQMPGEDGQVDEYETDSDCDETEIDGAGVDLDELALFHVQLNRTPRSGTTLPPVS